MFSTMDLNTVLKMKQNIFIKLLAQKFKKEKKMINWKKAQKELINKKVENTQL